MMGIQVILLDEDDDIISIRDRLDWARESQVVLVLPTTGDLLSNSLDLVLLRRYADLVRLLVGLVTLDGQITGKAKDVGLPTFATVEAAKKNHRKWRRRRWSGRITGRRARLDARDRQEVERRHKPRPVWQRWVLRYLAVMVYVLTLGALFSAAVYAVPGATVTFEPHVLDLEVSKQIVADPQLETVNASGASVPGRVMSSFQEWRATVRTTGAIEVPDSAAQGNVVFVNKLNQPVTVPAGSRVSTTRGTRVVFQTIDSVDVPGVLGATVEAKIVAVEPGLEGNVGANLINRLEGSLSIQLEVRNLEAFEGGAVRIEPAATEADSQRLKAQVLQQLQVRAMTEMEGQLNPKEFLARTSLHVAQILHETYSHFPGEKTDQLTLDMRAELRATAVDETEAVGIVYELLAEGISPGFELIPASIEFSAGDVLGVDNQGRVTFEMLSRGRQAAQLPLTEYLKDITGQEIGTAMAFLYEKLPLRDYPSVSVWPNWFGRVPYMSTRIKSVIVTAG